MCSDVGIVMEYLSGGSCLDLVSRSFPLVLRGHKLLSVVLR